MLSHPFWFDAHLDLAYLAACGRDMTAHLDPAAPPHPPAAVTLASLVQGSVAACLATIFTEPHPPGQPPDHPATAYPAGDADAAHRAGVAQLRTYHDWRDRRLISLWSGTQPGAPAPISLGILIENADPIRSPDQAPWWADQGVVAVGLAWATPSRYAGGNDSDLGLTDLGRRLIEALDHLRIVHDLSHLSQRATDQLLQATDAPVIASHSNCRSLLPGHPQRHLHDDTIREIARRGGVVGINLYCPFLSPHPDRHATIDHCVAHIERVCDLASSRAHVGLGSDIDGGFPADRLPLGIRSHADLHLLADALRNAGWSDDDILAFRWGNWARFWNSRVPCPP